MKYLKYWAVIIGVVIVGWTGSWFTNQGLSWYFSESIVPSLAPSGAFIGGVWTTIYALSAASLMLWLSQLNRDRNYYRVIWWFIANGVLNAAWGYFFFFKQLVGLAIVEMIGLEITVLVLIWLMWKKVRWSAILLIPYAVWVAFATYLAYSFWVLNR